MKLGWRFYRGSYLVVSSFVRWLFALVGQPGGEVFFLGFASGISTSCAYFTYIWACSRDLFTGCLQIPRGLCHCHPATQDTCIYLPTENSFTLSSAVCVLLQACCQPAHSNKPFGSITTVELLSWHRPLHPNESWIVCGPLLKFQPLVF